MATCGAIGDVVDVATGWKVTVNRLCLARLQGEEKGINERTNISNLLLLSGPLATTCRLHYRPRPLNAFNKSKYKIVHLSFSLCDDFVFTFIDTALKA